MFKNLEIGRYKTCGHGHPHYDRDGHYDEVMCDLMMGFCGQDVCPLDKLDEAERKAQDER